MNDFEPDWESMDVKGDMDAARAMALETVSLVEPPSFPVEKLIGPIKAITEWGQIDGLHPEAVGPSAIGAVSALLNGAEHIGVPKVQASIWYALIGTRSSGKTPAMRHAFETLMHYENGEAPILLTDSTAAAVPAELEQAHGSVCILADELTGFLAGLSGTGANGDTQSASVDLSFFRACWSGAYLRRTRVSTGTIIIPKPHLSIVGGLLPGRTGMLGSSRDGDLARWLPSLVPSQTPEAPAFQQNKPDVWIDLLFQLRQIRGLDRKWKLKGDGWTTYKTWCNDWRDRQYGDVAEHVASGLSKASDQAARMALIFAESMNPGGGGGPDDPREIPYQCVDTACAVVDYSMRCWESMLPPGVSAMDYQSADRAIASAVNELTEIIMQLKPDEDGVRKITKRRLLQRNACRIRNASQMDKLISAYEKYNPNCVERQKVRGGREKVILREPYRKPAK